MAVLKTRLFSSIAQHLRQTKEMRGKEENEKEGLVNPKSAGKGGEQSVLFGHDIDDDKPKGEECRNSETVESQLRKLSFVIIQRVFVKDGLRLVEHDEGKECEGDAFLFWQHVMEGAEEAFA